MRKALIAGIDHYQHRNPLGGCVDDALALRGALAKNGDGTLNFDCEMLLAMDQASAVSRASLRQAAQALFAGNADQIDVALFYFAGHGNVSNTGGYLLGSDVSEASDGLSLNDLVLWANQSQARHRLIFLDCCHSGAAAALAGQPEVSQLADGVTVLTASTARQLSQEQAGGGLFTGLMVEALLGGAANLAGDVTPGSVYAFVDQSLGAWQQRPVFKANVQRFVSLRRNKPPISLEDLREITSLFSSRDALYPLDPSHEPRDEGRRPTDPRPDPGCVRRFAILQAYNRLQLLVPVGAAHMWDAAMQSKACRLTPLGQHYWRLVKDQRL